MDIMVNVINQKLKVATNTKNFVSGTHNFIRFYFNLTSDWDNLSVNAQFSQDGITYNKKLDAENSVYLPSEIKAGKCALTLSGSGGNVIAATDTVILTFAENFVVSDSPDDGGSSGDGENTGGESQTYVNIIIDDVEPAMTSILWFDTSSG